MTARSTIRAVRNTPESAHAYVTRAFRGRRRNTTGIEYWHLQEMSIAASFFRSDAARTAARAALPAWLRERFDALAAEHDAERAARTV